MMRSFLLVLAVTASMTIARPLPYTNDLVPDIRATDENIWSTGSNSYNYPLDSSIHGSNVFEDGIPWKQADGGADGSRETRNADGTVTTTYTDGSSTTPNKDGSVTTKLKDGTVTSEKDEVTTTYHNNGSTTVRQKDGTSRTVYPDGGSVSRDKDGNTLAEPPNPNDDLLRIYGGLGAASAVLKKSNCIMNGDC